MFFFRFAPPPILRTGALQTFGTNVFLKKNGVMSLNPIYNLEARSFHWLSKLQRSNVLLKGAVWLDKGNFQLITLTLLQTDEKGKEMPGKTFWQDGGAMKTRKEQTSRHYLERSTKAVYKKLPHSENITIRKKLPFFINAIIPTRPKCYSWVNNSSGPNSSLKEERNSLSCTKKRPPKNVLQKTSHKEISRRGRAVTAAKRTKKQGSCTFAY